MIPIFQSLTNLSILHPQENTRKFVTILDPLKTPEKQRFFWTFQGVKMGILTKNRLDNKIFLWNLSIRVLLFTVFFILVNIKNHALTLPVPITGEERKLTWIFIFTILCSAPKCFMKALKAFKKSFEALQISVKIKIYINFYFNTTFWNAWGGKG